MSDTEVQNEAQEVLAGNREITPATTQLAAAEVEVGQLLMAAVNKGLDVEKLQILLDMKHAIDDRNAKASFAKALAGFNAKCPRIKKEHEAHIVSKTKGTNWKFKYANVEDIAKVIDPILPEFGLAYNWGTPVISNGDISVPTNLRHVDGHMETVSVPMPLEEGGDSMKRNAAHMKSRRLGLVSVLGINAFDDEGVTPYTQAPPKEDKAIPADMVNQLDELVTSTGANKERLLGYFNVKSLSDLKDSQFSECLAILERKAKGEYKQ